MDLSMGLIRADIVMARQGIELYKKDALEKYQSLTDKWYHSLKKQGIK